MTEVGNLTGRILDRRRARSRRWIIAGAALLAVLALAAAAWFTPLLSLEEVEVVGAERSDPTALAEGVLRDHGGVPLPRLPRGRIAAEIREADPAVAEVAQSWSGPRSITITVTERSPVAVVEESSGDLVVDAEGVVMGETREGDEALPRIAVVGDQTGPEELAALLRVLADMPEELRERIVSAAAPDAETLSFELDGDAQLRWGDASETELKSEVALILLAEDHAVLDVSTPRSPVTSE